MAIYREVSKKIADKYYIDKKVAPELIEAFKKELSDSDNQEVDFKIEKLNLQKLVENSPDKHLKLNALEINDISIIMEIF